MFSCPSQKQDSAFRVTIHDSAAEFRLAIAGDFTARDAGEVEQCWRTGASTIAGRAFVVDLGGVLSVDAATTDLLARMREDGARFIARRMETEPSIAAIAGSDRVHAAARARMRFSELLACLFARLRTWTWHLPAAPSR